MIIRTKKRVKQTAEVFTPPELVDSMLSKLPESVWAPDQTFLDNSAGDGNILVRMVAWKVNRGSTVEQALRTTYGVELMEDNVRRCRDRLLELADALDTTINTVAEAREKYGQIVDRNIVCHDALTYHYRFDGTNDLSRGGVPYDPTVNARADEFFTPPVA